MRRDTLRPGDELAPQDAFSPFRVVGATKVCLADSSPRRSFQRGGDTGEAEHHDPDQGAVTQTGDRRGVDRVDACASLVRCEDRCFALFTALLH
jgi:hypothetical protein